MGEDTLEHGHFHHGKQLLGRGVRQRAESGSLAAQEDNRLHLLVVVDVAADVAVVDDTEVGVGVVTGVDDALVAEPARSVSMAWIAPALGLGTEAPDGTNATVMSCPSASLMAAGS
jgi:hypothetical protein